MSVVAEERDTREQAAQRFQQLGWPTPRLEEWKYTNLTPLSNEKFEPATRAAIVDIANLSLADRAAAELVFIDGVFAPDLSTNAVDFAMSADVREKHWSRYADYQNHA